MIKRCGFRINRVYVPPLVRLYVPPSLCSPSYKALCSHMYTLLYYPLTMKIHVCNANLERKCAIDY